MDKVKNVFIHADGGRWIGRLGALMPNTVFEMDGFHLKKYFKKLFALDGAVHYAGAVKKALNSNNIEDFIKYCDATDEKALGECHDWSSFENACQSSIVSGKLTDNLHPQSHR